MSPLLHAMNGLRVAAKAWNLKLATVVKKVGLKQCPTEPSVFEGTEKDSSCCVMWTI